MHFTFSVHNISLLVFFITSSILLLHSFCKINPVFCFVIVTVIVLGRCECVQLYMCTAKKVHMCSVEPVVVKKRLKKNCVLTQTVGDVPSSQKTSASNTEKHPPLQFPNIDVFIHQGHCFD